MARFRCNNSNKEIATNCHVALAKADKEVLKYAGRKWNTASDDLEEKFGLNY